MTDYDLLITGGTVYDGSGAPGQVADVLITGDRIVEIGKLDGVQTRQTIDASGKAVAPGFVDVHTHSDMATLEVPLAEGRMLAGVTTDLMGHCGGSPFPLRGQVLQERKLAYADSPVELDWEDIEGYLKKAEAIGNSANRAVLVGHGTIRAAVMGYARRAPTSEELEQMKDEVRDALAHGAFGLSSGIAYPPGCYAENEELIELCRVVAEADGLYETHIRSEGERLIESVEDQFEVARQSGVRTQIAHLKVARKPNWRKIGQLHDAFIRARDQDGLDVTADRYPYTASHTGLGAILPFWTHEGGSEATVGRLSSPETRARIREEVLRNYANPEEWQGIVISRVSSPERRDLEGLSVAEVAEKMDLEPVEAAFDLLIAEKMQISCVYHTMAEENLRTILGWPFVMVGSDSRMRTADPDRRKDKPHPRAYGTSTRVLGKYVRETGVLTVEQAVHKLSGQPAQRIGLENRGLLKKGFYADVTVFDPDTVIDRATFEEPHQYPIGIEQVLVNGVVTVRNGKHTGAKAGRILKR